LYSSPSIIRILMSKENEIGRACSTNWRGIQIGYCEKSRRTYRKLYPMRWMIFLNLPHPSGRTRSWGVFSL
jgi:hypothetical protein